MSCTENNQPEESSENVRETVPCKICSRKFLPERLPKHIEVCERQRKKQRKVFDSSKQRTVINGKGEPIAPPPPSPMKNAQARSQKSTKVANLSTKNNWREQHEDFIRTVRQARGLKVEDETNDYNDDNQQGGRRKLPPGYVECPHCERSFSRGAAERHIPWCKDQKARIPRTPKNLNRNINNAVDKAMSRNSNKAYQSKKFADSNDIQSSASSEMGDTNGPISNGRPANGNSKSTRKTVQRYRSPSRRDATSKVKARLKMEEQANKHPKTPVMKFKEKFPNHVRSSLDSITSKFLQNTENPEEILKKPTEMFGPMIPKTVPGVRTRGLSPMRYDGKELSLETEELLRMKAQISEMYPVKSENKLNFVEKLVGLKNVTNGTSQIPSAIPKSKSHENFKKVPKDTDPVSQDFPRFCHQCGTKYPASESKFCHQCGAKRLKSNGTFL